jgi:glycine/D-amino acid oxidase-like deaminating enzyme
MKLHAYWKEGLAPLGDSVGEPISERISEPVGDATLPLPARAEVVVIGAGFCGLSAALALAKRGVSVVVLDANATLCAEASGRNGGHVNNGLAVDYGTLADRIGAQKARALYHEYDAAVDTVERIVREEQIDCHFVRHGKLKLASRPEHFAAMARSHERLKRDDVDHDIELLDAATVRAEVASDRYFGGLLYRKSAQMHMGQFAQGLAAAARRLGVRIHVNTPAEKLERIGKGDAYRIHTPRGVIAADKVLLATGASQHGGYGSFGWIRRRIVPIGSFILATAPLGEARAHALLAERRNYVTSANLHHYFRLSPDHRLIFGGRARFAVSNPLSDAKSGEILRAGMIDTFPQLADVKVDYCWGGLVDMTQDRLPHAGQRDGLFYAMGYSGHGTQMSVHTGERMASVMLGDAEANPWRDREWPAIPGHVGPPWFLPFLGLYFKLKDAVA